MAVIVTHKRHNMLELEAIGSEHFCVAQVQVGRVIIYLVSVYYQCGESSDAYLERTEEVLDSLRGKKAVICFDAKTKPGQRPGTIERPTAKVNC